MGKMFRYLSSNKEEKVDESARIAQIAIAKGQIQRIPVPVYIVLWLLNIATSYNLEIEEVK